VIKERALAVFGYLAILACLLWTAWAAFVIVMAVGFAGWGIFTAPAFLLRVVPPFFLDVGCLWLLVRYRDKAPQPQVKLNQCPPSALSRF
jgi:TRAP-type C4-dicarboxylate transport system permease small subunit